MKTLIFFSISFTLSSSALAEGCEQRAQKLLTPIKRNFMKELRHGLKEGPYSALESCHLKAPHLIEGDYNKEYLIGRASLKTRNPANQAPKWLLPVLAEYEKSSLSNLAQAKTFQVEDKNVYVEPIYIKAVCLKCHGNPVASVAKKIKKLYPNDEATGYKIGDFRGLFWVKEK